MSAKTQRANKPVQPKPVIVSAPVSDSEQSDAETNEVNMTISNKKTGIVDDKVVVDKRRKVKVNIPSPINEDASRSSISPTPAILTTHTSSSSIGSSSGSTKEKQNSSKVSTSANSTNSSSNKLTSADTVEGTVVAGEDSNSNGIWTNRFKKSPKDGKLIIEFINIIKEQYAGFKNSDTNELWGLVCSVSMNDIMKLYRKTSKRDLKKQSEFQPVNLEKPIRSGRDMFVKELCARNKANGITMKIVEIGNEWLKLDKMEQEKYNRKVARMKAEYQSAYDKQLKTAIDNGAYPEPKPKRPVSAYLQFRADIANMVHKKHVLDPRKLEGKTPEEVKAMKAEVKKTIQEDIDSQWKQLSESQLAKYKEIFNEDKKRFESEMKAWTERAKERGNGAGAAADD